VRTGDTIFALCSAPPAAGRCVVRVSGPGALDVAGSGLGAGVREVGFEVGGIVVPVVVYGFLGPASYTGEDVVELHVPGSPWVVAEILRELGRRHGFRAAEAGEFTARAFLAGKLDLTAAEGVAATIAAADARQLVAARQLLAGELAGEVRRMADTLAQLLALLEAGIDFTEEDISFLSRGQLESGVAGLRGGIAGLLARGRSFGRLSPHPTVVLAGAPNAGKSSLANALLGRERAVASPVAGTTRDVLWSELSLRRGQARLADVAGLEAGAGDELSVGMQERARTAMGQADVLVEVVDGSRGVARIEVQRPPDIVVWTKADLWGNPAAAVDGESGDVTTPVVSVSAVNGVGLSRLLELLDDACFGHESGHGLALTNRHRGELATADAALAASVAEPVAGEELAAAELRLALDALGRITGEVSPDDVLGRVFSTFCIGK
jgi:tRNA modification GTPase